MEDLMDFEYFLYRDGQAPSETTDRELFIASIQPALANCPDHNHDRRLILRLWLDARRKQANPSDDMPLPGTVFSQVRGLTAFLLSLAGFLSGSGLCASFLSYHGKEPLNVATFLALFVLSQIAILAAGFFILAASRYSGKDLPFSLIRLALWNVMRRLMDALVKKTATRLSRENLSRMESAWGLLKGRSRCYGDLFPWPLFILTQMFAVWFNVGLVTATLFRVLGTDLAFGWQSTLKTSAEAVYTLVRIMALPWSFAVNEPVAHPTLAQIEGTRMILKDGIAQLATADLVSWWPFLCLCLVFYGLVPRLVLLVSAYAMQTLRLNNLRFDTLACDLLMMNLTQPVLFTQGEEQAVRPAWNAQVVVPAEIVNDTLNAPLLALVPQDIAADCPDSELNRHLESLFGAGFAKRLAVNLSTPMDEAALEKALASGSFNRAVCLMEAFQPPILETMDFIRLLRRKGGDSLRIHVLLIGKPSHETLFTAPSPDETKIWTQKLNSLGDPNIRPAICPESKGKPI